MQRSIAARGLPALRFTVMCEPLHVFTVDERISSEGGAVAAALWPNGIAARSSKKLCRYQRKGAQVQVCAELRHS